MADIIVVLIIAAAALIGMRAGFVKAVFHLGYYIISAAAAFALYPILSKALAASRLGGYIHDNIIMPRVSVDTSQIRMPNFIRHALTEGIENTTEAVAASLTEMAINILCFLAVFIIVKFGLKLIVKLLNGVANLPLLSFFNKVGGLAVGAFNGVLIVYILLAISSVFMTDRLYGLVEASTYAKMMYNNNIILKFLFG
jgi:uncharacterized membrane protein required for colicin V production